MTKQPSPDSEALHKFLKIHRHLRQNSHNAQKQGIQGRQLAVLQYLDEANEATISAIQDYLYISPSTASGLVKNLENDGFVMRNRSEDDNRVVIVTLTSIGKRLAQTTQIRGIGLLRRRLPTLSDERLQVINEALADIMELMEVTDEE